MKKITRERLQAFLKAHASDEKTLDIGTGKTYYSTFFPNATTLDIDAGTNPDVVGDAHNLPFPNNSFEVVLMIEVLEHCHTPQKAVDEAHRVLKKGGKLILTTPFVYPLHESPNDYFRFTKYGLAHLMRDFSQHEIEAALPSNKALAALLQRVLYQTDTAIVFRYLIKILISLFYYSSFIKKEYGNKNRTVKEDCVFTNGHFVIAVK